MVCQHSHKPATSGTPHPRLTPPHSVPSLLPTFGRVHWRVSFEAIQGLQVASRLDGRPVPPQEVDALRRVGAAGQALPAATTVFVTWAVQHVLGTSASTAQEALLHAFLGESLASQLAQCADEVRASSTPTGLVCAATSGHAPLAKHQPWIFHGLQLLLSLSPRPLRCPHPPMARSRRRASPLPRHVPALGLAIAHPTSALAASPTQAPGPVPDAASLLVPGPGQPLPDCAALAAGLVQPEPRRAVPPQGRRSEIALDLRASRPGQGPHVPGSPNLCQGSNPLSFVSFLSNNPRSWGPSCPSACCRARLETLAFVAPHAAPQECGRTPASNLSGGLWNQLLLDVRHSLLLEAKPAQNHARRVRLSVRADGARIFRRAVLGSASLCCSPISPRERGDLGRTPGPFSPPSGALQLASS